MVQFVGVSEPVPLWVSVPDVARFVFIGTRADDPYGHTAYRYATGTSLTSLTPLTPVYTDLEPIAYYTQQKLLPFVPIEKILQFVPEVLWELSEFGLERREHIVLTPDGRWYLNTPIAEVNFFAVNDSEVDVVLDENGLIRFSDERMSPAFTYDSLGRLVPMISASKIEVAYAVRRRPEFPDDAIAYKVAARVLRAMAFESSGFYSSIRVGAVSFSFKDAKEIDRKASEFERLCYRLIREVVGL